MLTPDLLAAARQTELAPHGVDPVDHGLVHADLAAPFAVGLAGEFVGGIEADLRAEAGDRRGEVEIARFAGPRRRLPGRWRPLIPSNNTRDSWSGRTALKFISRLARSVMSGESPLAGNPSTKKGSGSLVSGDISSAKAMSHLPLLHRRPPLIPISQNRPRWTRSTEPIFVMEGRSRRVRVDSGARVREIRGDYPNVWGRVAVRERHGLGR